MIVLYINSPLKKYLRINSFKKYPSIKNVGLGPRNGWNHGM